MNDKEQLEYAKSLLSSHGISVIFQALEQKYAEAWKGSSYKDAAIREDAYHMVRALNELKTELESIAKSEDIKKFNSRLANINKLR